MADNKQMIQQKMKRGNKSILKMELEVLPSFVPTKTKGKLAQGTHLMESLKNGKGEEEKQTIKE